MIRFLLLFLFFIMFAGGAIGLDVSVAPGLSVKNVFLYSLFIIFFVQTAVMKNRKLEALSVIGPFSFLLAYCFLSFALIVAVGIYPNYGVMNGAIQLKTGMVDHYLMLLVFFYGVIKAKDVVWLIRSVIWLVMLGNAVTLADAFGMPDLGMLAVHYSGRVQGFIGQPNDYGSFLSFFLPATIALFVTEAGFKRFLAGIGVLATFVTLLLTFSRGSWLGVVVGAVAAAFFLRKHISMRAVTLSVTAAIAATVITVPLIFVSGFGEIFMDRLALLSGDAHTLSQGRSTLWLHALSVMMERPETFITGYGWNAYANFREFRLVTHNTYLAYLFNIGLIGLVLFLSTLSGVFTKLRWAVRTMSSDEKPFVTSGIFGFSALCVGMFFTEIFSGGILIWAFIGLILRLAIISMSGQTGGTLRAGPGTDSARA